MTDENIRRIKRGRGRRKQLSLPSLIDHVERTYYPTMHLHICMRSGCKRGGLGYKICGPEFLGTILPLTQYEQMEIGHWFDMEKIRGREKSGQIIDELGRTLQTINEFRLKQDQEGKIVERFCSVPPSRIENGVVHERNCDICREEAV